jgi:hypothetical protein
MGNKLDKEKGWYVFFSIPQPASLTSTHPHPTRTHSYPHPLACTPSCMHPQFVCTPSCTHTHPLVVHTPTHNLSFLNLTVLLQIHSLLPSLGWTWRSPTGNSMKAFVQVCCTCGCSYSLSAGAGAVWVQVQWGCMCGLGAGAVWVQVRRGCRCNVGAGVVPVWVQREGEAFQS